MAMRTPTKKETLLAFLARGVAMVHLDARRPGVIVPAQYVNDAHLRLNLSYRYSIPDLEVTEENVQATLSFAGRSFRCTLPWGSIFGITSHGTGDGQVWPEDLPVEVAHTMSDRNARPRQNGTSREAPPAPAAGRRPPLSAVEGQLKEERPRQDSAASSEGGARRHLRLVR
jgi:stringent starvation protein B